MDWTRNAFLFEVAVLSIEAECLSSHFNIGENAVRRLSFDQELTVTTI